MYPKLALTDGMFYLLKKDRDDILIPVRADDICEISTWITDGIRVLRVFRKDSVSKWDVGYPGWENQKYEVDSDDWKDMKSGLFDPDFFFTDPIGGTVHYEEMQLGFRMDHIQEAFTIDNGLHVRVDCVRFGTVRITNPETKKRILEYLKRRKKSETGR